MQIDIGDDVVEWRGSEGEMSALVDAVTANVTCEPDCDSMPDDSPLPPCATHAMLCSQSVLDSLLALRRRVQASKLAQRAIVTVAVAGLLMTALHPYSRHIVHVVRANVG